MKMAFRLNPTEIEERDDYDFWVFSLRDIDDQVLFRKDLSGDEYAK